MTTPVAHPDRIAWGRQMWVRLAVCFVFVTTLPLVVTAIYTTHRHLEVVRSVAAAAAADRVSARARALDDALETAGYDLLTVAEWPSLESYLVARAPAGADADFWRQKFVLQLRTFLDLKPAYSSINYADESGADRLSVQRRGTSTHLVETSQDAVPAPWLQGALQLLTRQVAMHTISGGDDLIVTYATRVRSPSARPRHVVWLEVDCTPLLQPDAAAAGVSGTRLALYDSGGVCLFPGNCPDLLFEPTVRPASPVRQYIASDGWLVSSAAVSPGGRPSQGKWQLALFEPAGVLEAGVADFRAAFLGVLGIALSVSILLGVWLARQLSRPLRRLYDASQRIGGGDFDVDFGAAAPDELGALGRQVGRMAEQLRVAHRGFERRLHEKTEQLIHAERLAAIGRTAAAVAHEINNPSGIISLYAQMLTEKLSPQDPNAAKLRLIDAKAREISRIVAELRDYSRKPAPMKESVEIEALFTDALEAAQGEKEASTVIHTEIRVDPAVRRICVDPHQMVRVMRNLIVNAYHAMTRGGTLRLTCDSDPPGGVRITVADTGTGISPEMLDHLFEPFYSTKPFGAGTGLGLAISREIVERHGGRIRAEAQPGEGATITITLPGGKPS